MKTLEERISHLASLPTDQLMDRTVALGLPRKVTLVMVPVELVAAACREYAAEQVERVRRAGQWDDSTEPLAELGIKYGAMVAESAAVLSELRGQAPMHLSDRRPRGTR